MRRFKPNAAQKAAFVDSMAKLCLWIREGGPDGATNREQALTGSVYFTLNGTRYRISSHKPGRNFDGETCFHAAPHRAPEIAAALSAGKLLNGKGVEI